ncbi:MAG: RNA polymerase sigma factor region1.1 domain-containing protein, partial [Oscillospiraceae bacterium]
MAARAKKEKAGLNDDSFDDGINDSEIIAKAAAEAAVPDEKSNEDRLKELIAKGKKVGKLTSKELMDVLESMN